MLRFHVLASAKAAAAYHQKADGGYLLSGEDPERRWLGKGAGRLGLAGAPTFEQFENLLNGLDPHTGEQLTAKIVPGRLAGWDCTASLPKGVTVAMLQGDERIKAVVWEAVEGAINDLQGYATTRVRQGGAAEDRLTGNLVAMAVPHYETRPAKADGMPDPDYHVHAVVANLTYDEVEGQWKAVKFKPIMELRQFFDRRFDLRLSTKLTALGYDIETKYKASPGGGQRYYSWDVKGVPKSVVEKFSRRTAEVEKLAADLGVATPLGKDKLGATSRLHKREDCTLADYRRYWQGRLTDREKADIAETITKAKGRQHVPDTGKLAEAVRYAIGHEFYRNSVVSWHQLAVTAMEKAIGHASPEDVEPEARRQGVLFKGNEVTTREVLAQERRVTAFARDGRGTCRPLDGKKLRVAGEVTESNRHAIPTNGPCLSIGIDPTGQSSPAPLRGATAAGLHPATLSPEQQALSRHVLTSKDRVILLRGAAGTGKTFTMKATIGLIDKSVAVLAPSADSSRGLLRQDFPNADTVAMFLTSQKMQDAVKGGVIWVDEAALLPVGDLDRLCAVAQKQDARIVLMGDPKQHRAVARDGNMFHALRHYAGLPMAELRDIRRQKGAYKEAVAAIERGDILEGHDMLAGLGWVRQTEKQDLEKAVADECYGYLAKNDTFVVIGITHAQNDDITAALRERLRQEGKIGNEEVVVEALKPLAWTDAEKGDFDRYDGSETIQFHQNSGQFKRGQRVTVSDLRGAKKPGSPSHFAVYSPGRLRLSRGDLVRVTAGGTDLAGRRLDNGQKLTFDGLDAQGNLALNGGKTAYKVKPTFGHLAHGLVDTSFKAQGHTRARTVGVFTEKNVRGINAAQHYVTVSRGEKSAVLFTTLPPETLREEIQKGDTRKSATELMEPVKRPKMRERFLKMMARRVRERYRALRERAEAAITRSTDRGQEREREAYGR